MISQNRAGGSAFRLTQDFTAPRSETPSVGCFGGVLAEINIQDYMYCRRLAYVLYGNVGPRRNPREGIRKPIMFTRYVWGPDQQF